MTETWNQTLFRVLLQVSCSAGPCRLFESRATGEEGLLKDGKGRNGKLLATLLNGLVEEAQRGSANQARRVSLLDGGARYLMQFAATPGKRSQLVQEASAAHRETLFRSWKACGSTEDQEVMGATIKELYGDFLPEQEGESGKDPDLVPARRALAQELVYSWSRVEHREAKREFARAMISLGLKELGEEGEEVTFSGRQHLTEDALFPGDAGVIVEPGWTMEDEHGEFLLQKARVTCGVSK
ncbi:MAG: hypothetical protein AAF191_19840 [Verrucomicrobiota bacterium]